MTVDIRGSADGPGANGNLSPSEFPQECSRGLPPDHAERIVLTNEVHARPPEALHTPQRATYVAAIVEKEERERELPHLAALCHSFGVASPAAGASHFSATLGYVRVKWERHAEFSGYTFIAPGEDALSVGKPASEALPDGWLSGIPGRTIVAAHATLLKYAEPGAEIDFANKYFNGNVIVGAEIGAARESDSPISEFTETVTSAS